VRSGAHVDPLTRQFPAFRSTGRITYYRSARKVATMQERLSDGGRPAEGRV